jgi:RNA-directed DNA polymerase
MRRTYPDLPFARYADDAVVHCRTKMEAESLLENLNMRMEACKLTLHPAKTKIVYCKDADRRGSHEHESFDFLSYTFQPRLMRNRFGVFKPNFLPAVSQGARASINSKLRELKIPKRGGSTLTGISQLVNPVMRGWLSYFDKFYKSKVRSTCRHLEDILARWAMGKFKKLRGRKNRAYQFLEKVRRRRPDLFYHWQYL